MVTTFSNKNHAVVSMLQSLIGSALAHLVKYSIVIMIYLAPNRLVGGLIDPTKSMTHFSNSCNVTCGTKGISSLLEGFPSL
jgi:hypothetical protein